MKGFIGILILFNIYFTSSLPVSETTEFVHPNPCTPKALYEVQYYHFCPIHDTKYIMCDPWGNMHMEDCPLGSKWIKESVECVFLNATEEWTKMSSNAKIENAIIMKPNMSVTVQNFTCSFYGENSCLNGGMCVRSSQDYKCLCLDEFSGRFCEVKGVKSTGVFGLLINSAFSLDMIRADNSETSTPTDFLGQFNQTIFNSSILSNGLVKKKIETYLSMFAPKTIHFDTLVINLLKAYLNMLSNKELFLLEFSSIDEIQIGFSNAITNLLYVSKYHYDSLDKLFAIYEQIISNMVKYLDDKEPRIREQAQAYFDVFEVVKSNVKTYTNWVPVNATHFNLTTTSDFIKQQIYKRFNETLGLSYELYKYLNEFQDKLSYKIQLKNSIDTDMIDTSILNFATSPEGKAIIDKIQVSNTDLWELLPFYGLSRVLSSYITIPADHVYVRETSNTKSPMGEEEM